VLSVAFSFTFFLLTFLRDSESVSLSFQGLMRRLEQSSCPHSEATLDDTVCGENSASASF